MAQSLVDTGVWLALTFSGHTHGAIARDWFESIEERHAVAFCRSTQQSYLRLVTTGWVSTAYQRPPLTNSEAWAALETLLSDDRVVLRREEPLELEAQWRRLSARATPSPKLWMDAYLAAFAVAGGYRLVTTDRAFLQFDGLDAHILGA